MATVNERFVIERRQKPDGKWNRIPGAGVFVTTEQSIRKIVARHEMNNPDYDYQLIRVPAETEQS